MLPKDTKLLQEELNTFLTFLQVDPTLVPFSLLADLSRCWTKELSAPSAIVGGFLGQEVLKVLSQKEVPFDNFFCHDAMEAVAFKMTVGK
jgi:hypothetical protein